MHQRKVGVHTVKGERSEGLWYEEERIFHINALELKAEKIAILSFTQTGKHLNSIHIQMENMVGCSFLSSKDGRDNQSRFSRFKLTNLELSHIKTDHSYCRAPTRNFECGGRLRVQKCEGLKRMDVKQGNLPKALLALRVSELKKYMSWKADPFSMGRGRDAFQTSWSQGLNYTFPSFTLIDRVLEKVQREKATLILVTPVWQTQAWFPEYSG